MNNGADQTGECEAFSEEPTKRDGQSVDFIRRDIANLGLELEAMAVKCQESARSLEGAHRAERLFVIRLLSLAIRKLERACRDKREFFEDVVEASQ